MSIKEIFNSDLMSRMNGVAMTDMAIGLAAALIVGLFIYFVYRKTYKGVMYSSGFGVTLVGLCMISAVLIMAVSSNVVLSLGMVGALSIVRFRTAIKEPMDILFLFWSISAGIILATGMIPLAACGTLVIGIVLLILARSKVKENPYMLVINLENGSAEKTVMDIIAENTRKNMIKSKTFSNAGNEELTVEVRLRNSESDFVKRIFETDGVTNAVMVSYNGDYMT